MDSFRLIPRDRVRLGEEGAVRQGSNKGNADDASYGRGYGDLFSSEVQTVNYTYCSLCSQGLGWGTRS